MHDVEDPELLRLDETSRPPLRVNRALVETDLVVTVTAAETVLHGGPAALLGAAAPRHCVQPARSPSSRLARRRAGSSRSRSSGRCRRHVPLIGVSLVLNQPQTAGAPRLSVRPRCARADRRSPLRDSLATLPDAGAPACAASIPRELTVAAVFAGPPSVAHAEALLRAVELRGADLDGQLDAIVIGVPAATPYLPRELPNPLLAAYLGLGLALRLWRDAFPVADGGTVILVNRFARRFAHPTQQPYRDVLPCGARRPRPAAARRRGTRGRSDARRLAEYRAGRTVHPLLPFRDWNACQPALGRLGAVLAAGTGDAATVRQLGFVPVHGVAPALELARGRSSSGTPRIAFLLSPPYFPLRVAAP